MFLVLSKFKQFRNTSQRFAPRQDSYGWQGMGLYEQTIHDCNLWWFWTSPQPQTKKKQRSFVATKFCTETWENRITTQSLQRFHTQKKKCNIFIRKQDNGTFCLCANSIQSLFNHHDPCDTYYLQLEKVVLLMIWVQRGAWNEM